MRLLPYGPGALLIELASPGEVASVRAGVLAAVSAGQLPGVAEVIPAARTVLVAVRREADVETELAAVRSLVHRLDTALPAPPTGRTVTLPVIYDGPDLELVASTAGLSTARIVALHCEPTYTVAFCGFAPGFGYLTGLPPRLRQPRLATPRAAVPAGAVGIASEFTGAYPRSSPGGWRLLGRTGAVLFDPRRTPPALLAPGDQVRFEAIR